MPAHQLRPMTTEDIPAVLAIEEAGYPSPGTADNYRRDLIENDFAHYAVLTTLAGDVVGHGGFWLLGAEAQIMMVIVHPAWRGRGLGDHLFVHLLEQAAGAGAERVTLEVRRSNVAARALYEKYGFIVVGERPNYYPTGSGREDALLMDSPPLDESYLARLAAVRAAAQPAAADPSAAPCKLR